MTTSARNRSYSADDSLTEAARVNRAQLAERSGHWSLACAHYETLIRTKSTSQKTRLDALRWLGRAYLENGNRAAATDVLEAAVAAARLAGDGVAIAQAINVVAIVEQRGGNLEKAAALYVESKAEAISAGDRALVAMIDQNAGTVANIRGDISGALDSFRMSLAGYQELGMPRYSGQVLNNIGLAYVDLGNLEAAEECYAQALLEFAETGDRPLMDEVAVNQVQLWIAMGRYENAERQASGLLEGQNQQSMPWIGEVYRHLGVIARERADYSEAEKNLDLAMAVSVATDDLLLRADVSEQRAELFWLQERHAEMLLALNTARSIYARMDALGKIAQVERRNSRLEQRFLEIAKQWGDSIEGADPDTQGHCERVADLACALAQRAGIDSRDMFWFRLGALLHDVGKIIVPAEVLNKPGALTPDEWTLMKRHPEAGLELVAAIDFPGDVRAMIRSHHERWDGMGYPDGLVGDSTPLTARILCIADVYDALTSARPYRTALPRSKGIEIMCSSPRQFDPDLLVKFLEWTMDQEKTRCA